MSPAIWTWILFLGATCAPVTGESSCSSCISRSWTCDKRCRARDTQLHELDFKYHEQPCREIIPWNGSTTQIDTDLWCAYPATRRCNMFFCNPQIECSNMYRHKPLAVLSSMTSCQASAAHKDFITQNCSWVCKHGRPVSRCQIHVDSSGAYGLQQNIKKCWVQETCNGRRGQKAVATCEPKAKLTAAPSVTLSGVMILTVAKAQEFLAQRHVDFALRDAISQMVPEPSYSKIVTEPRVETHNHLSGYSYPAVKVYFNISIPGGAHGPSTERAIATEMAFQNKSRSDLLNVVNGALSNQGLTDLALDALLDMNPLNFTDVHGPGSEEEFFEIVDTLRLYQKHLEQVQEELSDTSTDLQIQNLSQKDMAVVLAKHQSAQTRLSEILHAQSRVSKQIEDMIAQRNSTHKAFQRAQHAAQAAGAELETAIANESSEAELAALQAQQLQAEKEALAAVKEQEKLNDELKANATSLAAAIAVMNNDLTYMRKLVQDAQQEKDGVLEDLEDSRQKLEEERAGHLRTHNQLQSARMQLAHASETNSAFGVIFAVMAILILVLMTALAVCTLRRKSWATAPMMQATQGGNSVVVGRPVQVDAAAFKTTDDLPGSKGAGPTLLTSSSRGTSAGCMGSPTKKPGAFQ